MALSLKSSGVTGPHPSPGHEQHTDHDHEEGEELTAGKPPCQRRIRLSETFTQDTHQCIGNEKDAGQHSVGQSSLGSQDPEEEKKKPPLKACLHKLGGISR